MCLTLTKNPETTRYNYVCQAKTKKVYKILCFTPLHSPSQPLFTPFCYYHIKSNILKSRRTPEFTSRELSSGKINFGIHVYIYIPTIIYTKEILVECTAISEDCVAVNNEDNQAVFTKIKLNKVIEIGSEVNIDELKLAAPFLEYKDTY